ncbi:MAG: hypothetical protein CMJ83_08415 [Planctomycetes bacterium]|nr:hypothetical protein [Planctomycetota bacterium]
MKRDQDRTSLKRILDLCQEVQQLSDALADGPSPGHRRRLRARHANLLKTLLEVFSGQTESDALPGLFRELGRHHGLDAREMLLLFLLLERRIAGTDAIMEGRELLQLLSESSFDVLQNAALLHGEARLVASGLIRAHLPHSDAALEGEFRISERFYRRVYRRFHERGSPERSTQDVPAYENAVDHYLDLRHLVNLYQKRAALLFPQGYWLDLHPEVSERPEDLDEAIVQVRQVVERREELTSDKLSLPLVALRGEFGLESDEEVIILALLFQELFASSPLLESAELLRLVASSDQDVFKKRSLLTAKSRLLETGIIALDVELDDKQLLAGAYLPEWVSERLLHQVDSPAVIRQDERREFHDYLEGLDSSEDFYRNL